MVMQAPYGTWNSPITAETVALNGMTIDEVLVDRISSKVYHIEKRPSEGGRNVVVDTARTRDVFGAGWNARSGVHEYGGAAALVHDDIVYFSHYTDGRIYKVNGNHPPEPVTPENTFYRYANFEIHPVYTHILVAVLEDHTISDPSSVVNCVCVINTLYGTVDRLVTGADFYAALGFSPDGSHFVWKQWFHPQMPWDGSELHIATVVGCALYNQIHSLACESIMHIAGDTQISVSFPSWANNDVLVFISDKSGYLNPWKYTLSSRQATPVLSASLPFDFGSASVLGDSSYAFTDSSGSGAVFSVFIDGRSVLFYVNLETGTSPLELTPPKPYALVQSIRQIYARPSEIVFLAKFPRDQPRIVACMLKLSARRVALLEPPVFIPLKSVTAATSINLAWSVAVPVPITLNVTSGQPLHIVVYISTNGQYSGSSIPYEKPPLLVNIHGGPTKMAAQCFDWTRLYFTTRGWAWVDVNYGGSSGYGRKYIERLTGKWGIVDVQDAIFAAKALSRPPYSISDPDRTIIRGASGGGFTTLAALSDAAYATVFAAGTSLYGISDFRRLAECSHKYERRYTDGLLGGRPDEIPDVYIDRSPVSHADRIAQPLLIMQGAIDKVVPKEQSEIIVKSIQDRGGFVRYKLFEGEGHGWRKAATIREALETELKFYKDVLGIPDIQ